MPDLLVTTQTKAQERDRAIRLVQRHVLDDQDQADLLEMLGLDQTEVLLLAPRPHGALTAAEVHELFAPFAAERAAVASH